MTAMITRTGSIWSVLPGIWSGRRDSNPGSHAPKACALARLRYAPRAGFYGDRLTGGGWRDGQLLRPVISAVGRRIDHVIAAGVPGEHPTRGDAYERGGECLRRVVDPAGAAKDRAAVAGDDALRDIGRRAVTDEDGVLGVHDAEARWVGIGAGRHAGEDLTL